jgi:RimJ/RimL family protein N-acetyltransferase
MTSAFDGRTERLLLRRWRDEDVAPFVAMCVDPRVMEFFPAPLTSDESAALLRRADGGFDSHGYGLWALERRDSGEFIGFTGLAPMPAGVPGEGGVEVGWRLAAAHWGMGLASEAARYAVRFAFDELKLAEVNSITAVLNTRSQAVMRRIGMVETDRFEHPRLADDSPLRPHVRFMLRV